MILVDTNIVSEMMRSRPDPRIADWVGRLKPGTSALSVVTIFELRYGMSLMPNSTERRRLEDLLRRIEAGWFGSILDLDHEAALRAAEFRALRRALGRPIGVSDSLIAGIARSRGARLATRNIRDFEAAGLDLVDPFHTDAA